MPEPSKALFERFCVAHRRPAFSKEGFPHIVIEADDFPVVFAEESNAFRADKATRSCYQGFHDRHSRPSILDISFKSSRGLHIKDDFSKQLGAARKNRARTRVITP